MKFGEFLKYLILLLLMRFYFFICQFFFFICMEYKLNYIFINGRFEKYMYIRFRYCSDKEKLEKGMGRQYFLYMIVFVKKNVFISLEVVVIVY